MAAWQRGPTTGDNALGRHAYICRLTSEPLGFAANRHERGVRPTNPGGRPEIQRDDLRKGDATMRRDGRRRLGPRAMT